MDDDRFCNHCHHPFDSYQSYLRWGNDQECEPCLQETATRERAAIRKRVTFGDVPVKPWLPFISAHLFRARDIAGTCIRCLRVVDRVFDRNGEMWCEHCVDVFGAERGRGGGKRGGNEDRPRNQPRPYRMHGPSGVCVTCGETTSVSFFLYRQVFMACGWGCAGRWADWQVEQILGPDQVTRYRMKKEKRELAEGEAYVRKSLGVEE